MGREAAAWERQDQGEGTLFQSPGTKTLSSSKWLAVAPLPVEEGKAYVNGKVPVERKLLSSEAKVSGCGLHFKRSSWRRWQRGALDVRTAYGPAMGALIHGFIQSLPQAGAVGPLLPDVETRLKSSSPGAEEMAQWLRALPALPEV